MSQPAENSDVMKRKKVLITGASSGFGRLAIHRFLRDGWFVIATMRRAQERMELFAGTEESAPGRLVILEGDITKKEDRKQLAEWIRAQAENRLDALVNNAGFGLFGAFEDLSEDGIRYQMEVNFFGTLLLTQDLLPSLRQARGCIISVSSFLGIHSLPFTTGYCASKFAVEGWMESMAGELLKHGVNCYLVEPGGYPTAFGDAIAWPHVPADSVYAVETARYQELRRQFSEKNAKKDPAAVARLIHRLAVKRPKGLRHAIGADAKAMLLLGRLLPRNLFQRLAVRVFHRLLG